jgi:outer membrane protein assembly factor BamD (BamD/ComL family)
LLAYNEFEAALNEYDQALVASGSKAPGDEALFNIALIYANPANRKKDYNKATASFQRLVKDFPQSQWVQQATSWMETLKEIDRLKRTSAETVQENERLRRTSVEALQENERLKRVSSETLQENERLKRASAEAARASAEVLQENQKLKRIVEQSRIVDIEIDEKKRSQAK